MALSAGESFSGGQVRDTQSRSVVISETTDAALTAGEFFSGGFLCDADSRTVICQDAAHSALTANEQYTAGDVRDKAGRLVCAAETVNSAISAGSQFSGGWLRDSKGRRIIALDTLGSALSAGEQFTSGQIRDSQGRLVIATEAAVGSAYDAAVLADNPVGFWPLSEASGTLAHDKSTNANNGAVSAGVTFGQAGIGDGATAALFNGGASALITVPDSAPLKLTSPFSFEAWGKPADLTNVYVILSKGLTGPGYALNHVASTGILVARADGAQAAGPAVVAAAWNYIAVTWDGTTVRWYLNGTANGTASWPASPTTNALPLLIGQYESGLPYNGLLAKIALYNTVLTPTRITAHFAAG